MQSGDQRNVEAAERLTRRRAWTMLLGGGLFLLWQGGYVGQPMSLGHMLLWFGCACALLLLLVPALPWSRRADAQRMMEDEGTKAHRQSATSVAFWAMTLAVLSLFALNAFVTFAARDALHIVMSVGVGAGVLGFAGRELAASRDV